MTAPLIANTVNRMTETRNNGDEIRNGNRNGNGNKGINCVSGHPPRTEWVAPVTLGIKKGLTSGVFCPSVSWFLVTPFDRESCSGVWEMGRWQSSSFQDV